MKAARRVLTSATLAFGGGVFALALSPSACTGQIDLGPVAVAVDADTGDATSDDGGVEAVDAAEEYGQFVPDTGSPPPPPVDPDASLGPCVVVEAGSVPVPPSDASTGDGGQCTPAVDPGACGAGAVWQVRAPYSIAYFQQGSSQMVVDGSGVLVATQQGVIVGAAACAAPSVVFADPDGGVFSLFTADPAAVYAFGADGLLSVPRSGGTATTLFSSPGAYVFGPLVEDAATLYFVAGDVNGVYGGSLIRVTKSTGVWSVAFAAPGGADKAFVDGNTVFWEQGDISGDLGIDSMPATGQPVSLVGTLPKTASLSAFGVSDGVAAFIQSGGSMTPGLYIEPFCGPPTLVDPQGTTPMAVGAGYAYYAAPDGLRGVSLATGAITKMPVAAGPVPDGSITNIAIGPDGVYYATRHCIYRLPS